MYFGLNCAMGVDLSYADGTACLDDKDRNDCAARLFAVSSTILSGLFCIVVGLQQTVAEFAPALFGGAAAGASGQEAPLAGDAPGILEGARRLSAHGGTGWRGLWSRSLGVDAPLSE